MIRKFLKLIGIVAGALTLLVLLLLLAASLINWRDAPPSADYRHLEALIANRPPLADAENGFVYLLGIRAAPESDPRYLGSRRLTWLESLDADMSHLKEDPGDNATDFTALRSPTLKLLADTCDTPEWRKCHTIFDVMPDTSRWPAGDRLLLERYRELIRYPEWREHVGTDVRQPIATFVDAMYGQRVFLMALRGSDSATLHEMLSRDHAFWRKVLSSSDTLIAKMIAVSALRQNFRFGNLLLRRLPPADAANSIPDGWRSALTREELSIEQVLAGELVQLEKIWRNPADDAERTARIPFYQPQDIGNNVAADYRDLVAAFDVPLSDYARVAAQVAKRKPRHPFPSRIYNIGGDYLRQLAETSYRKYPPRVAAVEAWRRAALTLAELRARGVPAARIAAELATAPLRNPFDGRPFAWSDADQAVVYDGTEDQVTARRRQIYVY